MRLFRLDSEDYNNDRGNNKCGGCNWDTDIFYVLAGTPEDAVKLLNSGDAGLCGNCIADLLSEKAYEIKASK